MDTEAIIKNLKEQGLTSADIIELVKTEGWAKVRLLVKEGSK